MISKILISIIAFAVAIGMVVTFPKIDPAAGKTLKDVETNPIVTDVDK